MARKYRTTQKETPEVIDDRPTVLDRRIREAMRKHSLTERDFHTMRQRRKLNAFIEGIHAAVMATSGLDRVIDEFNERLS